LAFGKLFPDAWQILRQDPFSGYVFAFANRCRKAIKILIYDGQGFRLCQERLSRGRFPWWPPQASAATETLEAHQQMVLLTDARQVAVFW
jgi:transposase